MMVEKVKASLTDSEAPPQTPNERLHLQIVLALLQLANPDPKQINKLANKFNIPLLGFQTPDEVASYLEALIRSGTSEEEKSGTVFFMGNTGLWVLSCRELESREFHCNAFDILPHSHLRPYLVS